MKPPTSTRPAASRRKGNSAGRSSLEKPRKEVIAELTRAEKAIERLRKAESHRKKEWEHYEEITHALKERVKELNCLYSISNIVEKYGLDLDEVLLRTVEIIPDAWQYPEITCCRVQLGHRSVQSPDFIETGWMQSQDILVSGEKRGTLDVFYREPRPEKDEGPFLREERSLIRVIAERIGKILERHHAEEALKDSEQKTSALLNAIPDLMFQVDRNGTLVGFHEGTFVTLRELGRKMIGKDIYTLADPEKLIPRRLLDQGMLSVRRAIETGNPQMYEQHTSINGHGRDFEVRMVVCRRDEVLGIVRDITNRKQLEREILEISNREQRRIGQDLHDSLSQHLTGIGFMGKVLEKKAASHIPLEPSDIQEIVELIDQAITMTRGFARGLNPVELQADGLMHALGKLAENMKRLFGVSCTFVCSAPIFIYDNEKATHLYRIVQEALNNAIKHGKADEVAISLDREGTTCVLTISDNGIGYGKTPSHGRGMGLSIMRYRASMIEATIDIRARPQGGTDLVCCFQVRDGF
ncbi:MAG TPA: PAS domain-containing sensor histidine kinase [Desulfomonilia bacterium]|nr:PAS domain-containing sensor histidine kinase [Desulfomonilia bacterium]